jgi:phosphoesterase RecJ-like protein
LRSAIEAARHPVLTTHINADGDGAGSEVAMALYMERHGVKPEIVNPTPFPETFKFLLHHLTPWSCKAEEGRRALERADLFVVLDTSEPSRLGDVYPAMRGRRIAVIDHHPSTPQSIGDPAIRDASACATGELIYDLITTPDASVSRPEAEALYVAIVTDTGSFRFANTTSRTHEISASLLRAGVDPQEMYRQLYGQVTDERLELLRRALLSLERDPEWPLASITLRRQDFQESRAASADLEGIVEHARQLRGVEIAALFRELPDKSTKVSLRSNGEADVAAIAREHGGGGHTKAAGVHIKGPLEASRAEVLASARLALRKKGLGPTTTTNGDPKAARGP